MCYKAAGGGDTRFGLAGLSSCGYGFESRYLHHYKKRSSKRELLFNICRLATCFDYITKKNFYNIILALFLSARPQSPS